MSATVVLDADFLSAFLKIEELELIRSFYRVPSLHIPPAVYREIAVTDLLPRLAGYDALSIEDAPASSLLAEDAELTLLGAGEQEAIALTLASSDAILLMNDKRATACARRAGVTVVNIPAFLLACRQTDFVTLEKAGQLVRLLRERDHYGFSEVFLQRLMAI